MSTLTLFFSSDCDIDDKAINNRSGLDHLVAAPREQLITELVKKSAHFISENYWKLNTPQSKNPGNPTGQHEYDDLFNLNLNYSGNLIINGPGSGYFLRDERFKGPTAPLKWREDLFIRYWNDETAEIAKIIKSQPLAPQYDPGELYETLWNGDYGKDWILRRYKTSNNIKITSRTDRINQINLIGWSRGAISCHMLANILLKDPELNSIPVNILAIDPVVGSMLPRDNQRILGGNVKEYVGFYARDERSSELPGILPDTAPNTKVHIYPIPGRHTTLVGNRAADGDKGPDKFSEPNDLVLYLAMSCLRRWDPMLSISATDTNNNHADMTISGTLLLEKMKSDYSDYVVMRNTTYSSSSTDIKGEREIYLNGQYTNFTSAQGDRFTPNMGLAKGHILDISYFSEII